MKETVTNDIRASIRDHKVKTGVENDLKGIAFVNSIAIFKINSLFHCTGPARNVGIIMQKMVLVSQAQ